MHFEILIEDKSGEEMLNRLMPKMLNSSDNTYKIHSYNGIGSIPKGMKTVQDPSKRALLNQLPRLLSGYGKASQNFEMTVIVICDLDDRNQTDFLKELNALLNSCNPAPNAHFCLAIEEGEAWLLGDWNAIKKAYPKAKEQIFKTYKNDCICGTWEKLADVIYPGGKEILIKQGPQSQGLAKTEWAKNICFHMDVENNKSPSFNNFKQCIQKYSGKF